MGSVRGHRTGGGSGCPVGSRLLTDPTYDQSEADAAAKIVRAVRQARADDPTATVYVVGYSQGAGTVSNAPAELESDPDFDSGIIEFVVASSPRRISRGF